MTGRLDVGKGSTDGWTPLTLVVDQMLDAEMRAMARITCAMDDDRDPITPGTRRRIARWVADRWGGEVPDA